MSAPSSLSLKRVAHDLIDATCQEILLLRGEDPDSIASHASYTVLVNRWNAYMKLLESGGWDGGEVKSCKDDDQTRSGSKGSTAENSTVKDKQDKVRCRSTMASLVASLCMRPTYPKAVADASAIRYHLPALISMKASEWKKMRDDLGRVRDMIQIEDVNLEPTFESILCQIEAMETLANLRKRLVEALEEIGEAEGGSNPAVDHECVMRDLDKCQLRSRTISGKLRCIQRSTNSHPICFTNHVAWPRRRTTAEGAKDAVTSLVERIDATIAEESFPLQKFQVQLLELLRNWNKYLPSPTLFKNGYFSFKRHSEMTSSILEDDTFPADGLMASPTAKTTSPAGKDSDRGSSSDSDIEILATFQVGGCTVEVKSSPARSCGQKRERNASPPKKRAVQLRRKLFELKGSPTKYSPRKKRIPYSTEEKRALLDGVNKFGVGHWKQIREHYDHVFGEHNRTNVNLKDLYRNLTKDE